MKREVWEKDRAILEQIYLRNEITRCEYCGGTFGLSLHHLERRSSGKAKNTFEDTRLLCACCHHKADNAVGHVKFNEMLKKIR